MWSRAARAASLARESANARRAGPHRVVLWRGSVFSVRLRRRAEAAERAMDYKLTTLG